MYYSINRRYEPCPKIKLIMDLRKCSEIQIKGFMALYSPDNLTRTIETAVMLLPDSWIEKVHKEIILALKTDEAQNLEQIEFKYPDLIKKLAKLWQKDRSEEINKAGIKSQKEHNLLLRAAYEHSPLD